ncbi:MAG: GNAT family N-acetyltransferase, partial [Cyanobacteria bacterium J06648_11]
MTILKTTRLRLRPVDVGDRDILVDIRSAPEVLRWLPHPQGNSIERYVDTRLAEMLTHWRDRNFGVWMVHNRRSGRAIGYCGLRFLPEFDAVELLYAFHPLAWGCGLASEASRTILDWAWSHT